MKKENKFKEQVDLLSGKIEKEIWDGFGKGETLKKKKRIVWKNEKYIVTYPQNCGRWYLHTVGGFKIAECFENTFNFTCRGNGEEFVKYAVNKRKKAIKKHIEKIRTQLTDLKEEYKAIK